MFPFVDRASLVEVQLSPHPDEKRPMPPLTLELLHETLGPRLTKERVPPDLATKKKEQWHWCWVDDENPISAGPYLLWGYRRWVKRPPGSLIKELVAKRCRDWCRDHAANRAPKSVKAEIVEAVTEEITRDTPPSLSDEAVLLSTDWTIYTFTTSAPLHAAIVARVREAFETELGMQLVTTSPHSLKPWLQAQRPTEELPGLVVEEYLVWLAEAAFEETWFRLAPKGAKPEHVRVELDGKLSVVAGDAHKDKITYEGTDTVHDAVKDLVSGEADDRVRAIEVALSDGKHTYDVSIASSGFVRTCEIRDAIDMGKDYEQATVDRAEHFRAAVRLNALLWQAFDLTKLQRLMRSLPQQTLWPCASKDVEVTNDPPPREPTPIERAAAARA